MVHNNKLTAGRHVKFTNSLASLSEQGSEGVWVLLFATHHSTG
jgi:hypothetical protein